MRSKSSSQKGASAVEFALVLPLLMLITFGIIEFGMFIYNQQVITNASREGARAGIVASMPRVTPDQIEEVVHTYCLNNMVTFGAPNTPTIVRPPVGYSATAAFGSDLRVQVNYQYSFLVIPNFISGLYQGSESFRRMQAITVMRYE